MFMLAGPLVDQAAIARLLPKRDAVVYKLKVKKARPRVEKEASEPPSPSSPLLNAIDSPLRHTFQTGRPLSDHISIIQCKTCKRPMLTTVAAVHIRLCIQKHKERAQRKKEQKEANRKAREARDKQERAEEEAAARAEAEEVSDSGGAGGPSGGAGGSGGGGGGDAPSKKLGNGTSKKRKADVVESDKAVGGKKKTKKELEASKPKAAKPKGPVDVERQCGVLLPNGACCARSLTCKSHAMGAKRAVPGRSLPYDLLLAQYQKKNQAKQQKAAIDANAPLPEDFADPAGPVDSDEEKDLVMAALARWRPAPAAVHVAVPLRRRYNYVRVKEMLAQALGGGGAAAAIGPPAAATPTPAVADPPDLALALLAATESRRQSVATAAGPRPQLGLAGRKPSVGASASPAVAVA